MAKLEVHDIKTLYSATTERYLYRIVNKEMAKGNETFPFSCIERLELGEPLDGGTPVAVRRGSKGLTLPKDIDILFNMGKTLIELSGIQYEPDGGETKKEKK